MSPLGYRSRPVMVIETFIKNTRELPSSKGSLSDNQVLNIWRSEDGRDSKLDSKGPAIFITF